MKKVKLEYIAGDAARKLSLKKRKSGLFKKARELSILCDINACIIIFIPNSPHPEVWPNLHDASSILRSFKNLPDSQRTQRRSDLQTFRRLEAQKTIINLEKEIRVSRKLFFELLFSDCLSGYHNAEDLSIEETTALALLTEIKIAEISAKIGSLRSTRNGDFSSLTDFDLQCVEEFHQEGTGSYRIVNDPRNFPLSEPCFRYY